MLALFILFRLSSMQIYISYHNHRCARIYRWQVMLTWNRKTQVRELNRWQTENLLFEILCGHYSNLSHCGYCLWTWIGFTTFNWFLDLNKAPIFSSIEIRRRIRVDLAFFLLFEGLVGPGHVAIGPEPVPTI